MDKIVKQRVAEMMLAWTEQAMKENSLPAMLILNSPTGLVAYVTPDFEGAATDMQSADGIDFKKILQRISEKSLEIE